MKIKQLINDLESSNNSRGVCTLQRELFEALLQELKLYQKLIDYIGETQVILGEIHPDLSGDVAVMPESQWEPVFNAYSKCNKDPTPESPKFKVGEIVRYGHGPTAIMRIDSISVDHGGPGWTRYYGTQHFGGAVGAYEEWIARKATPEEIEAFNKERSK